MNVTNAGPGNEALPSESGAAIFVGTVWAIMTVATLAFVLRYADDIPHLDEWVMVPLLTGEWPFNWQLFWSQHNEHRFPAPRLIYFSLAWLTGGFRTGIVVNVLLLSGLALTLLWTARRARGRAIYADALFPLALLNWGQCENLFMSFQIAFILPVVLAGLILAVMVLQPNGMSWRGAVCAAVCLVLLPMCGAIGLALMPALAVWAGYRAVRSWRSPLDRSKGIACVLAAAVIVAFILMAAYFVGYERPGHHPDSPSLWATLKATARYVSMALGPIAPDTWPYSGIGAVAFVLASAAALPAFRRKRSGRGDTMGLMLFLAATGCLALAIGVGRAGLHPNIAWSTRYLLLMSLAVCCAYWIWDMQASVLGRAVQMAMFTVVCLTLVPNCQKGMAFGRHLRFTSWAFEHDLRSGMPPSTLAERHRHLASPDFPPEQFASHLAQLRAYGWRVFRRLHEEPVVQPSISRPTAADAHLP